MAAWCKILKGRRSSRSIILWNSMPYLFISILFIAILWITLALLILFDKMDRAVTHLLVIKKADVIRQSVIAGFIEQQLIQIPIHNNYIFTSFLKEVLSGRLPISESMNPSDVSLNFNDVELKELDFDHSQWYSNPDILSFEDLPRSIKPELRNLLTLFPLFKAFLSDTLTPKNGAYNTIYYSTQRERLFLQYPAFSSDILK